MPPATPGPAGGACIVAAGRRPRPRRSSTIAATTTTTAATAAATGSQSIGAALRYAASRSRTATTFDTPACSMVMP